jgi:hypothetical protein
MSLEPQAKKVKDLAGLLLEQALNYVCKNKSFHQRGAFIMSEKQKKINVEMADGMQHHRAGKHSLGGSVFQEFRPCPSKAPQTGPVQKELDFQMARSHIEELESKSEGIKKLHLTLMDGKIYKVFGVASNILDKPGDEIITRRRGRCGKSEQAHDVLKNDFGGSHVPSRLFGVNTAWWNIAVLAMNVTGMLKMFFLPEILRDCRMKKLRNVFFTLAAK